MAVAVSMDDVSKNAYRTELEGGGVRHTMFFNSDKSSPHAFMVEYDPNRVSRQHFHQCDQFQIIIGGSGTIGHHALKPYSVHFSRANTPYGPLVASPEGLTFLTLRRRWDPGALRLPESRQKLESVTNRRPWQVTDFATLNASLTPGSVRIEPIGGVRNDEGLAAYTLELSPNARGFAPDPSRGEGQYIAILEGSLFHEDREHGAITIVNVENNERPFELRAGARGLKGFALTFPRINATAKSAANHAETQFKTWQCVLCAFIYDEEAGLPEEGIAPGTPWADVPETWTCPDCAATKADFQMVEI